MAARNGLPPSTGRSAATRKGDARLHLDGRPSRLSLAATTRAAFARNASRWTHAPGPVASGVRH